MDDIPEEILALVHQNNDPNIVGHETGAYIEEDVMENECTVICHFLDFLLTVAN